MRRASVSAGRLGLRPPWPPRAVDRERCRVPVVGGSWQAKAFGPPVALLLRAGLASPARDFAKTDQAGLAGAPQVPASGISIERACAPSFRSRCTSYRAAVFQPVCPVSRAECLPL